MGRYITVNTLKKYLGSDNYKDLVDNTINVGENYFRGQYTNVLNKASEITNAKNILTNASAGVEDIINFSNNISTKKYQAMAVQIAKGAANTVFQQTSSYLTSKITGLVPSLEDLQSLVTNNAMTYFNKFVKKPDFYIEKFAINAETKIKIQQNEKLTRTLNEISDKLTYKIGYIQTFTSYINSYLETGLSYISTYLEYGPEWVTNTVDKKISKLMDFVIPAIDKKTKILYDERDKVLNNIARFTGQFAADITNKATEKYYANIAKKAKNAIMSSQATAAMTAQDALMKIATQLGVSAKLPNVANLLITTN